MSRCGKWCVALFVLVNITSIAVGEDLQEDEFQSHTGEDGKRSLQKRDAGYGQSNQHVVNVRIPACNPKTEYITTQIYETIAVRSHCVQKVVYSSTREVVSTSTECKGYMCNPKIPYVHSEDHVNSDVEAYDNPSSSPYVNYTLPEESYPENYPPEYGPLKQSSLNGDAEIYDNPSFSPYVNYTLPEESYPENYPPEYGPPKHSSLNGDAETYVNSSSSPYVNYTMHEESYPENYPKEYGPPKLFSLFDSNNEEYKIPIADMINSFPTVYKHLDYGVLSNSVTPETTPTPTTTTTTTTISYKAPSSSHNKSGLLGLSQIASRLRDSFLRGFYRTDDLLKQSQISGSVTTSNIKSTYFTAVVKDPGHPNSIFNEILASRPSPQISAHSSIYQSTSSPSPQISAHSSIYQPTSIDLTAYSDFVPRLVANPNVEI